ncbi:uncharacterized protein LOC125961447 isoform X2 [Orcinus orca]|uniref:uncharacterized protein LOC125961447 isoform X2 n=1 Tax=Orcinus orca TaxID=9733 RepID=UPI00211346D3|nr:uncharacterized protein LOC125961447 isoform X2 [Orcinus orca]
MSWIREVPAARVRSGVLTPRAWNLALAIAEGRGVLGARMARRLAGLGVRRECKGKPIPEEARSRDRPKPRASQSWTFRQGAVAPGFGSDDTAQGGLLSHRGAYRGQQWAAPLTWPTLPLWGQRAWHWR